MFRLFPKGTVLEVFNKTSIEDQARLAQVDKRFNEISKDKTLELSKYKTECTVHSVGHTHVVLQKAFEQCKPSVLHATKGNKKVLGYEVGFSLVTGFSAAMEEDTLSTIKNLNSMGLFGAKKIALFLQEALEEENRSTLKNRK